jgi:ferritin
LLSNRISELGDKAPSDPAVWKTQGNIGVLDPVQYLTLRAALEKGLEFEGKAVENYNNIAKKALEYNDFVTYNLATQILADEVKDEQHTEDVLKNLEVK